MKGIIEWLTGPVARAVVLPLARPLVLAILAALLGVLTDAGLLDGELGRALVGLLN